MKKNIENLKRVKLVLRTAGRFVLKRLLMLKYVNDEMVQRALQRPGVKRKFEKALQKSIMTDQQWKTLYPENPTESKFDSNKIDTLFYAFLVRKLGDVEKPENGWNLWPRENDMTRTAHVVRIKLLCEETEGLSELSDDELEICWTALQKALLGLHYDKYALDNLRTCCVEQEITPSYIWYHIVNSPDLHRGWLIAFLCLLFILLCIIDTREYLMDVINDAYQFILWNYYKYF